MKKIVIFIIIIIILIIIGLIIFLPYRTGKISDVFNEEEKDTDDKITGKEIITDNSELEDQNSVNKGSVGGTEGSEGAAGTGGGAGSGTGTEDQTEGLPSDLYTRGCGFYFDEYKICGGTCPSGTCMQEGRSCYCKKV
jgi:hypothetical protein